MKRRFSRTSKNDHLGGFFGALREPEVDTSVSGTIAVAEIWLAPADSNLSMDGTVSTVAWRFHQHQAKWYLADSRRRRGRHGARTYRRHGDRNHLAGVGDAISRVCGHDETVFGDPDGRLIETHNADSGISYGSGDDDAGACR
jgi:hypothetical protein